MARRKGNSGSGCLIVLVIMFLAFIGSLIGQVQEEEQRMQNARIHKTMAVLENPTSVAVAGNKAVSYVTDESDRDSEPTFSDEYIPEGHLAQTPEEVRYIVYCTTGTSVVGRYGNSGGLGYVRWAELEILDRTTNTIIAQERFTGGNPPNSVKGGGNHYGSYPSSERIEAWILSSFQSQVTVYATVPAHWANPGCWAWSSVEGRDVFDAWPGESMTRSGEWYVIGLPTWIDHVIVNANEGSVQTADLAVGSVRTLWIVVKDDGAVDIYHQEPDI